MKIVEKQILAIKINIDIDVKFWALTPNINVNLHSLTLELEFLCFALYIDYRSRVARERFINAWDEVHKMRDGHKILGVDFSVEESKTVITKVEDGKVVGVQQYKPPVYYLNVKKDVQVVELMHGEKVIKQITDVGIYVTPLNSTLYMIELNEADDVSPSEIKELWLRGKRYVNETEIVLGSFYDVSETQAMQIVEMRNGFFKNYQEVVSTFTFPSAKDSLRTLLKSRKLDLTTTLLIKIYNG